MLIQKLSGDYPSLRSNCGDLSMISKSPNFVLYKIDSTFKSN
jgi:hypothetical protein